MNDVLRLGLIALLSVAAPSLGTEALTSLPARQEPQTVAMAVETASKLSPDEKVSQADAAVTTMRQALREIISKVEEATATKDSVKLNCVKDKQSQLKGLVKQAETAQDNLSTAIAEGEQRKADQLFVQVSTQRSGASQLVAEANQCVGENEAQQEASSVEVEAPTKEEKKGSSKMTPAPRLVARPPAASPTL